MKSDTADMSATLVSGAAEPSEAVASEVAEPSAAAVPGSATRTLIRGIDPAGRIMQCDRHAPKVLGRSPGELLGAELGDLTSDTEEQKDALAGLINAMRAGRESTTMLCLE